MQIYKYMKTEYKSKNGNFGIKVEEASSPDWGEKQKEMLGNKSRMLWGPTGMIPIHAKEKIEELYEFLGEYLKELKGGEK